MNVTRKWKMALDRSVTFANFVDRAADLYGDRTSFILDRPVAWDFMPGTEHSYIQWQGFVHRMAAVLTEELGVRKGDRVVVDMSNRIEIPYTCAAIMKAGGVAVPLNFMLTGKEIAYIAGDSGARLMITDRPVYDFHIKQPATVPTIERWALMEDAEGLDGDFVELKPLLEQAPAVFPAPRMDPDELVGIFYTSGTTGFPKGAMMSSRSLLTAQRLTAAIIPTTEKDTGLMALPLAHLFGFGLWIIGMSAGLTSIFMRSFNPNKILTAIEDRKVTIFVGAPAMYAMMLEAGLDSHDISSVRIWGSSSDAMPDEISREFSSRGRLKVGPFDVDSIFLDAYGMVELSSLACPKMPLPGLKFPPKCVGFPMPPIRMRVLDEDGGKLAAGEVGELAVKGPCVTLGYWAKPEETAEQMSGGWFRTGDMARKDRIGRVYFVDRKKDVVKSGGYSVFSVEVEQEILEHPAVCEAAVVGIPHPTKKEVPVAVVVLEEGSSASEEELHAWCRDNIARYKSPRRVIVIAGEEMPRTPTMKVLKRELRDRYKDMFAGESRP
jgi:acyl-CoA synthetase (AMP-forming)/AMP-acid ligase II